MHIIYAKVVCAERFITIYFSDLSLSIYIYIYMKRERRERERERERVSERERERERESQTGRKILFAIISFYTNIYIHIHM